MNKPAGPLAALTTDVNLTKVLATIRSNGAPMLAFEWAEKVKAQHEIGLLAFYICQQILLDGGFVMVNEGANRLPIYSVPMG